MLFGALVINYTPKDQEELIRRSQNLMNLSTSPKTAFMLDEFVLRLSFDSDWDEAEKILLKAAREVTAEIIKETGQEPYIRADMSDWYGVYMRLRFMTLATDRPKIMHDISKRVFKAIQSTENVDLAIPYVYSFRKGFRWAPPYSLENVATMRQTDLLNNAIKDKTCPRCTNKNSSNAIFCDKCGERLDRSTKLK